MNNLIDWKELTERLFLLYSVQTQEMLGEKLGVSQDQVSKWVRNRARPTWDLIAKVVQEKGVSWEWLITGKSDNIRELINIHTAALESQVKDGAAYAWAKEEILSSVFDTKMAITNHGELEQSSRLELANRLLFAATHKTELDVSGHMYGDIEMTDYVNGPLVLAILQRSGYDDSYLFGYLVAEKVLRDCSELNLLYPSSLTATPSSRPREPINSVLNSKGVPVVGEAASEDELLTGSEKNGSVANELRAPDAGPRARNVELAEQIIHALGELHLLPLAALRGTMPQSDLEVLLHALQDMNRAAKESFAPKEAVERRGSERGAG